MACVNEDKLSKNLPYNPIILKNEEFLQEFTMELTLRGTPEQNMEYIQYQNIQLVDDEIFVQNYTKNDRSIPIRRSQISLS